MVSPLHALQCSLLSAQLLLLTFTAYASLQTDNHLASANEAADKASVRSSLLPPPPPVLPLGLTECHDWESNPPGGNGARARNVYAGPSASLPLPPLQLDSGVANMMETALENIIEYLTQTFPPDYQVPERESYEVLFEEAHRDNIVR